MSAQPRHVYTLRVYFEDTDAGGVVYHANYLCFAERARTEALRDLGVPHADLVADHGLMFMVRRVKLDYQLPARLDDEITVITETRRVGGASVALTQRFAAADGRALAALDIELACVRLEDGKPARIPARWRQAFGTISAAEQSVGDGRGPGG
jgi:acyl-CoA thioester hydrolase